MGIPQEHLNLRFGRWGIEVAMQRILVLVLLVALLGVVWFIIRHQQQEMMATHAAILARMQKQEALLQLLLIPSAERQTLRDVKKLQDDLYQTLLELQRRKQQKQPLPAPEEQPWPY